MISPAELKRILEPALAYPSGDNVQPFTFEWKNEKLWVYHDDESARHLINPQNFSSIFAFGAFLACLEVSALANGYDISFEKSAGLAKGTQPWGAIQFYKKEQHSSAALLPVQVLLQRKTVRDHYRDEKVKLDSLPQIDPAEASGVRLYYQSELHPELTELLLKVEETNWLNTRFIHDVFDKVQMTAEKYKLEGRGLYWRDLGVLVIDYPVLFLIKKIPALPKILWHFGFKIFLQMKFSQQLKYSGGFALMTLRNLDADGFLTAGRVICKWWLRLTQMGLVAQPLSAGTMGAIYASLFAGQTINIDTDLQKNIKKQFALNFHLKDGETPVWMLRFGWPIKKYEPTLRRHLDEVLKGA